MMALLNRKFHTSQISHQNVTFGKVEICVWSITIILGVKKRVKNRYVFVLSVKNWFDFPQI